MPNFLKTLLVYILLVLLFVTVFEADTMYAIELLFVPAVTIFYYLNSKNRTPFFNLFLVVFSISNILSLYDGDSYNETFYFICNSLYILSYAFLFIEIARTINIKKLVTRFPLQIVILLLLDGFIIFALISLITPIEFETNVIGYVRLIEHVFDLVLLLVFNISFLNYLQKNNNKSLLLFIGCLTITFSEILILGYYYFSENEILNIFSLFLMVCAFVLFYFQSTLKDVKKENNLIV